MTCDVTSVASSVFSGIRSKPLHTLQMRYWRAIHAEFMTHRAFSRNAGSSRAIPVKTMLKQIWSDPAGPIHWGANQAGMQADAELRGWRLLAAKVVWRLSAKSAAFWSWLAMKIGLHKQVANRITEPYQYINVVVSATDWDNFFELRCHPDAQPEIQELADKIQEVISSTTPQLLKRGEWHLPYLLPEETAYSLSTKIKLSVARCARVSYAPFDGNASIEAEIGRHDRLLSSRPIHASPAEHQAMCTGDITRWKNFSGWMQYRQLVEDNVQL